MKERIYKRDTGLALCLLFLTAIIYGVLHQYYGVEKPYLMAIASVGCDVMILAAVGYLVFRPHLIPVKWGKIFGVLTLAIDIVMLINDVYFAYNYKPLEENKYLIVFTDILGDYGWAYVTIISAIFYSAVIWSLKVFKALKWVYVARFAVHIYSQLYGAKMYIKYREMVDGEDWDAIGAHIDTWNAFMDKLSLVYICFSVALLVLTIVWMCSKHDALAANEASVTPAMAPGMPPSVSEYLKNKQS